MDRWAKLRIELLKDFYATYMESHTAWVALQATNEVTLSELLREADYLVEKGWLRSSNGYQLTAAGRDHVERHLLAGAETSKMKPIG